MKTKIRVTFAGIYGSHLPNQTFTVEAIRRNDFSSGQPEGLPFVGMTDDKGECIIELLPAWYPYRIVVADRSFSCNFMVVDTLTTEPVEIVDLALGHLHIDPFSPSTKVLQEALKALVQAKETMRLVRKEKEELLSQSGKLFSQDYAAKAKTLETLMDQFKTMVDTITKSRLNSDEELKKTQAMYEKIMQAHSDMILAAHDMNMIKAFGGINMNGHYLWFSDDDKLRWRKGGMPTDQFDGTPIN